MTDYVIVFTLVDGTESREVHSVTFGQDVDQLAQQRATEIAATVNYIMTLAAFLRHVTRVCNTESGYRIINF